MSIIILGSEGFIGHHLVNYFLKLSWTVYGCDLFEAPTQQYQYKKVSRLSPELDEVFTVCQYDACINAAGSGNVNYSMTHPVSDFEANSLDVIRTLECIRRFQRSCRYVHISSAAVYGNPVTLPITENTLKEPVSPYGYHKLISENICEEYSKLFSVQTAIIRPFSVYGPGLKKQLLWDICQKMKNSSNDKITLFGTGEESRDFIYIDDLIELIYLITVSDNFQSNVYNAASGIETKIKKIAEIIQNFYPAKKINFSGQVRLGDPINWRADITKATNIGFKCKTSIEAGTEKYIHWFNHQ